MRLIIEENYTFLSQWAGNYVASRINAANPTPENHLYSVAPREALRLACTAA